MKDKEVSAEFLKRMSGASRARPLTESDEVFIREKVSRLPRDERLVTYLYFWEGVSAQTISATLKIPTTLVFKIIENALLRLRPDLESLLVRNSIKISNLEAAA